MSRDTPSKGFPPPRIVFFRYHVGVARWIHPLLEKRWTQLTGYVNTLPVRLSRFSLQTVLKHRLTKLEMSCFRPLVIPTVTATALLLSGHRCAVMNVHFPFSFTFLLNKLWPSSLKPRAQVNLSSLQCSIRRHLREEELVSLLGRSSCFSEGVRFSGFHRVVSLMMSDWNKKGYIPSSPNSWVPTLLCGLYINRSGPNRIFPVKNAVVTDSIRWDAPEQWLAKTKREILC